MFFMQIFDIQKKAQNAFNLASFQQINYTSIVLLLQ